MTKVVRLSVPPAFPTSIVGMAFCECLLRAGGMWKTHSERFLTLNFPAEGDVDWDAELKKVLEVFEGGREQDLAP